MNKILTLMVLLMAVMSGYGQVEDIKKAYREKVITRSLNADNKYDLLTLWRGQQTRIFQFNMDDMKLSDSDKDYEGPFLRHCVHAVIVDNDTTYFVGFQGCVYAEEGDVRLMVEAIDKMIIEYDSDSNCSANEILNKFVTEDGLEIKYGAKKGKGKRWTLNSPMVGFVELRMSTDGVKKLRYWLTEDLKFIDDLKKTKMKATLKTRDEG